MKNHFWVLLMCFFIGQSCFAQDSPTTKKRRFHIGFLPVENDTTAPKKKQKPELFLKNEASVNIGALIIKKVDFNYERHIKNNHCLRIGATISDGAFQQFQPDFFTVKVGYTGYFSKKYFRGFYINPYLAYSNNTNLALLNTDFGVFFNDVKDESGTFNGKFLASGLNFGYKWGRRKLRLGSEIGIFRNILGTEKIFEPYEGLEIKMGLNFGYRF